jgi:FXSXX-COOH protein
VGGYGSAMNQNHSQQPAPADGPERISLVRLAAQSTAASSPALTRVVSNGAPRSGPGRVAIAAFNSSV